MNLRDVLGLRPKADTAAALRASLADTKAALVTVQGVIAELEAGRGGVLLDGTEAQAAQYEANLAEARAEAERFAAIAAALPARIAAAEARERGIEMDALANHADAQAEAGAELLPRIVQGLAEVLALMRQHDAIADKVAAANRELKDGGRARVTLPMARAFPQLENRLPGKFNADHLPSGVGYGGQPSMGFMIGDWLRSAARRD